MEFNLDIDPNVYIHYNLYETTIRFAPANLGYERYHTSCSTCSAVGSNGSQITSARTGRQTASLFIFFEMISFSLSHTHTQPPPPPPLWLIVLASFSQECVLCVVLWQINRGLVLLLNRFLLCHYLPVCSSTDSTVLKTVGFSLSEWFMLLRKKRFLCVRF